MSSSWFARSQTLLSLGFPELAVADAYKSIYLNIAALDYGNQNGKGIGEKARLYFGMFLWITNLDKVSYLLMLRLALILFMFFIFIFPAFRLGGWCGFSIWEADVLNDVLAERG